MQGLQEVRKRYGDLPHVWTEPLNEFSLNLSVKDSDVQPRTNT